MRTVELAKVAAAAEALRLRRITHRQAMRAAYAAGAAVFAIAVFVLLHVLGYMLLCLLLSPILSALIVMVVDMVVAGVLAALAMGNKPDAIETEALQVRKQAVVEMRQSVTTMALAAEIGGMVLRRRPASVTPGAGGRVRLLGEIAGRVLSRR